MDEQRFKRLTERVKSAPAEVVEELGPDAAASPSDDRVWYILGRALLKLGQFDAAGQHFARAVRLSPENAYYIYYVGLAAKRLGKQKEADAAFAEAHRINPNVVPENYRPGPPQAAGSGSQRVRSAPANKAPGSMWWLPETHDEFEELTQRLTERALAERKAGWRAAYRVQKVGIFVVVAMVLAGLIALGVAWFTGANAPGDDAAMKQCQLLSTTMKPENLPQWCKDLLGP